MNRGTRPSAISVQRPQSFRGSSTGAQGEAAAVDPSEGRNGRDSIDGLFTPNKLQAAVENRQLPSSPLDEISFQRQALARQSGPDGDDNGSGDGGADVKDPNDITEKLLAKGSTGLDAIDALERRFSMISVESSATTGRLLDHLGLNEDEEQIDWSNLGVEGFRDDRPLAAKQTEIAPHPRVTIANRTQQLQNIFKDKRHPSAQQQQIHQAQNIASQQRRAPNYAPADKFPSLQRRFVKSPQVAAPRILAQPKQHVDPVSDGTPKKQFVPIASNHNQPEQQQQHRTQDTTNDPPAVASPQPSPVPSPRLRLQQSPMFNQPRRFAKDFSDQFESVSPQRKPVSPGPSAARPRHTHSHSNPINMVMARTPQRSGSRHQAHVNDSFSGSSTPSPKQSALQRTPSTPVAMSRRDANRLIFAKPDQVAPETRVQLALKLKAENQPQEASYQLQLAAEQGNKDAMFLYGISLRYGYGVKKDDRQSFLWLCRAADIDLIRTYKFEIDPFELSEATVPARAEEPLSSTMLEIGKAYMNGWGVERDENYGIQFIEKSASLGFAEAMLEAGNIWSAKGLHRKKNMHRSACWYRLADKFGKKLIGNSWIYKPKYMERA